MRKFFFAAVMVAGSAHAAFVFKEGPLTVTFLDAACPHVAIGNFLTRTTGKSAHHAKVIFQGKPTEACWSDAGEKVIVLDQMGVGGYVEKSAMKKTRAL